MFDEDDDYCYECGGYGDDYYVDENGNLVSACEDCPHNKNNLKIIGRNNYVRL